NAEGATEYEKAAAILKPLAEGHPEVPVYALSLAGTYSNWGNFLKETGKLADALKFLTLAVNLSEKILAQDPQYALALARTTTAHSARAQVHQNMTHWQQAIEDWDRVIALTEASNKWRYRVARAGILRQAGKYVEAAAEAEALGSAPDATNQCRY